MAVSAIFVTLKDIRLSEEGGDPLVEVQKNRMLHTSTTKVSLVVVCHILVSRKAKEMLVVLL